MKKSTKQAVIGLAATILGMATVVVAMLLLIYLCPRTSRLAVELWGSVTFIAIILTLLLPKQVEDRQIQNVLVAIPTFIFLAGFVLAIYVKDVCGVPRYPAEDTFVNWYEGHLRNVREIFRRFYGRA